MLLTMKILQVNEEKPLDVLKHKRKSVRICKLLTVPIVSLPDNSTSAAHDFLFLGVVLCAFLERCILIVVFNLLLVQEQITP